MKIWIYTCYVCITSPRNVYGQYCQTNMQLLRNSKLVAISLTVKKNVLEEEQVKE